MTVQRDYEYLGNFSVEATRCVGFTCDACCVAWDGCSAASSCPKCGTEMDYWCELAQGMEQVEPDMSDQELIDRLYNHSKRALTLGPDLCQLLEHAADRLRGLQDAGDSKDALSMVDRFDSQVPQPELDTNAEVSMNLETWGHGLLEEAEYMHDLAAETKSGRVLRVQLMTQELGELIIAIAKNDREQILREGVDLNYTLAGTMNAYNLRSHIYYAAFRAVHAANLAKGTTVDAAGRRLKPSGWAPADLRMLLPLAPSPKTEIK